MPLPCDHPSRKLWFKLSEFKQYPDSIKPVREQIQGTSFFPGGIGLWRPSDTQAPEFPFSKVMVLGQDFDTVSNYEKSLIRGKEDIKAPTWHNLLIFLKKAKICPEDCFFTNAFMGLRIAGKNTGPFPGSRDKDFKERCQRFFIDQLCLQRPRLILSLGAFVPRYLAELSDELPGWETWHSFPWLDANCLAVKMAISFRGSEHRYNLVALTHPSCRKLNVGRRKWGRFSGDEAEVKMVQHALEGCPNLCSEAVI